jgi:pSer/pThr/pTyr-binding forkhead associated (FHA) protein
MSIREVNMQGEAHKSEAKAARSGPQGTQVYSREEIAALLDEGVSLETARRASLVLMSDGSGNSADPRVFPLGSDRLTVGRSPICDVCIEEPSLSSEHARLVHSEDAWRIINLLSTNGVFVNGEKVFSHRLEHGDEIRLGRAVLRFQDPNGSDPASTKSGWLPWLGVVAGASAVALLLFWALS